jgi:hypothetical protein
MGVGGGTHVPAAFVLLDPEVPPLARAAPSGHHGKGPIAETSARTQSVIASTTSSWICHVQA